VVKLSGCNIRVPYIRHDANFCFKKYVCSPTLFGFLPLVISPQSLHFYHSRPPRYCVALTWQNRNKSWEFNLGASALTLNLAGLAAAGEAQARRRMTETDAGSPFPVISAIAVLRYNTCADFSDD
jgi:hypothetical protein